MTAELKDFLERHIDLVDSLEIEELYKRADELSRGRLSDVLIDIGIDPLQYLSSVIDSMFYLSSIDAIVIPNNITNIREHTFTCCTNLTSIVIPESIQSIGKYAFFGCTSLRSVNYLGTIEQWCNISFNSFDANPVWFAKKLYLNGKLVTDLVIPDGITSIGNYVFCGCESLTSVTIPESVTSIGDYAFFHCLNLTEIRFNKTVSQVRSERWHVKKKWRDDSNITRIICTDGEIEL